jgi:hypothetical protein
VGGVVSYLAARRASRLRLPVQSSIPTRGVPNTDIITDMLDYLMHIQFMIRKVDETKLILNKVLDYNKERYLILRHTFDIIDKIYSLVY